MKQQSISQLPPADPLLTCEDAAAYLNVSVKTLANWRCAQRYLSFVKIGRRVFYRLSKIETFINRHSVVIEEGRLSGRVRSSVNVSGVTQ